MKDYENHYYNIIKMTINKRVTIDNTLNKLHEMQLDMIDQAVEYSDLQQAREVIKNIIDKKITLDTKYQS